MNSGIYRIRNRRTAKVYVGQTTRFDRRFRRHRYELVKGIHSNTYLQRAVLKHGIDSIVFEIIEEVSAEHLTPREQYWINHYKDLGLLYNTCLTAGSCAGVKHTPESREKISASKRGKNHTSAAIERMRLSHSGFKHTDASRERMKEASKAAQASAAYRARKAEIARAKWEDPEFRATMIKKMQEGRARSDEGRNSHATKMRDLWGSPEYKEKVSAAIRRASQTEESRQRRSAALTLWWKKRKEGT